MVRWLIHRKLAAFEKDFGYDASYMHDVLDTDFGALMKFARATAIGNYRKDVPVDVHAAVTFVGVIEADCGPCAQLMVTMALRRGVPGRDDREDPAVAPMNAASDQRCQLCSARSTRGVRRPSRSICTALGATGAHPRRRGKVSIRDPHRDAGDDEM